MKAVWKLIYPCVIAVSLVCVNVESTQAHCPNDSVSFDYPITKNTTNYFTVLNALPYSMYAGIYITYSGTECNSYSGPAAISWTAISGDSWGPPDRPGFYRVYASAPNGIVITTLVMVAHVDIEGEINNQWSRFDTNHVYMPVGSTITLTATMVPNLGAARTAFQWDSFPGQTFQPNPLFNDYIYVDASGDPTFAIGRYTYPTVRLRYLRPQSGLISNLARFRAKDNGPIRISALPHRYDDGIHDWVDDRFTLNVFDFNINLIDGLGFEPQWSGGPPTMEKPITNTVDSTYTRIGSLTGGASLIVIQLERLGLDGVDTENEMGQFDFQSYTITLRDPEWEEAGAKELGSLWSGDKDNLPPLPTNVNAPGSPTLELGADELAVFYRAPVIWAFGKEVKERSIRIEVRGPNMDENDPPLKEVEFTLHKPPLVLVHGINSDSTTWTSLQAELENEVDILLVDYSHDPGRDVGIAMRGVDQVTHEIFTVIGERLGQLNHLDIAATRVDYLGHSYGGLNARWWLHMPPEGQSLPREPALIRPFQTSTRLFPVESVFRYYHAHNYGSGYVRCLMTIGTPHQGGGWANFAVVTLNNLIGKPLIALRRVYILSGSPNIDAVCDLHTESTVVNAVQAAAAIEVNTRYYSTQGLSDASTPDVWSRWFAAFVDPAPASALTILESIARLPGESSDWIVSISSQRNGQDGTTHFQAAHWNQNGHESLQILISDSLHSQDMSEFATTSSGAGL